MNATGRSVKAWQQGSKANIGLDIVGGLIAGVAALLLFLKALRHFDDSWDGTAYHLVLAAFRAHILTLNDFEPIPNYVAFYRTFPQLLDTVRGYVWRITGSILVLQTFNLFAIGALLAFWRRRYGLGVRWTLIAVLTVPLIQIGSTTLYVDTFSNCFFAIALSALTAAFVERRKLDRFEVVASLAALAVAANVKPQFVELGTAALVVLCLYQLATLRREGSRADIFYFSALAAVAWLLVPLTAVHNVLAFGNPVYPVSVSILGHQLPGLFPSAVAWKPPDYLAHMPQPVRWLASILEYRAFDGRDLPYTIDQFGSIPVGVMPSLDLPRPPSFRMGGYFAPLVFGLLGWLLFFTRVHARRDRWRWVVPLLLASAIAFVPGSNELRYYSFWILNLIFLCFLAARWSGDDTSLFYGFLIVTFLSVGMITGWRSFDPTPYSVQDHINKYGIDRVVTGRDLCFENRNRDTILFTWIFHNKGRYRIVDLPPGESCPSHQ